MQLLGDLGLYTEAPFDRVTSLGMQTRWLFRISIIRFLSLLVVALIIVPVLSILPWWVGLIAYFVGGYINSELVGKSMVNSASALAGISWGGVMVVIAEVLKLTPWSMYSVYSPVAVIALLVLLFFWGYITSFGGAKHDTPSDEDPTE